MNINRTKKAISGRSKTAQTALELAVFGSVVVFVIGLIVRSVMTTSYAQNHRYKAFRLAMLMSFEFTEGLKNVPGNWRDGTASRNSASVLVIEDRLSVESSRQAPIDRVPQQAIGGATHSRNLFMPIDPGEFANLPVIDYFINGVHFVFTTANVATKAFNSPANPTGLVYQKENNHPALPWCDCGGTASNCVDNIGGNNYYRFDLDRNGALDDGLASDPAMDAICQDFWWQWIAATPSQIDGENGEFTFVDVDGDLHQERIVGINGRPMDDLRGTPITANVVDFQEGDMDFTIPDPDPLNPAPQRPTAGITTQDIQMFTFTKDWTPAGDGVGTYLQIDEGQLYQVAGDSRRYVRSAQRKDSLDLIQRTVQLSNDTGRFCNGTAGDGSSVVQPGTIEGNQAGWTSDVRNPVEVCCPNNACCFTSANATRICMVIPTLGGQDPHILVRSRITDKHGRKWITPTDGDPFVQYLYP